MNSCKDTTLSLGVYLLGALDPAEHAEVEAHLAECALCRAELDELAGLPVMLERLTLEDLTPEPVSPSDDLFERVAAEARAEHESDRVSRHRRYRRLTAVAAAFVVIVGGGIGGWAALRSSHDVYRNPRGPVHMQVALASQASGTGLAVTVSGLPTDEHCKLVAVSKDGTRDVAGRWYATYQGRAKVTGSTSIPQSQLDRLVLFGTGGERLASVAV
jgi:predicted anti-sigma-YlaC factor YlaD